MSVELRGDRAELVLDTDVGYQYWAYCIKEADAWREVVVWQRPSRRLG